MRGLWLRNLTVFKLANFPTGTPAELEEAFAKHRFHPCGAFEMETHGFAPAFDQNDIVRKTGDVYWMQIKSERKLLPGSVVRKALDQRIADLEARGLKIGRRSKRELKEQISEELMAKAFAVDSMLTVLIDPVEQYLVIDSSSRKKCEMVVSLLTACFSGLELETIDFDASTSSKMAEMLLTDEADPTFSVDGTLVLQDPQDTRHSARFVNQNLGEPEVRAHLVAGMRVAALELTWNARINFVLAEPFSVRRLRFLEVVQEQVETDDGENTDELIDAQLLLQSGELRGLLADLMRWLERKEDGAADRPPAQVARAA